MTSSNLNAGGGTAAEGGTAEACSDDTGHAGPARIILILTRSGHVSDRIQALEKEFSGIRVKQVDTVAAAFVRLPHPVALILIDAAFLPEIDEVSAELSGVHDFAQTAIIQPAGDIPAQLQERIVRSRYYRSVLPMGLRLDVWLAIVRLMLCGGEYFPLGLPARVEPQPRDGGESQAPPAATRAGSDAMGLTARERQILEKAAQGMQNKLIAAEFSLSEHTVKVHVHNIISKLGVHNRTEAAARFRRESQMIVDN